MSTERVRLMQALVQSGTGLRGAVGAAYRGIVILSHSTPAMARFADTSAEVLLKIVGAQQYYLLFVHTGDELSRATALGLTRSLAADARRVLRGAELESASRTLLGWTRVLEEGANEAELLKRAQDLKELSRERGMRYLARRAARSSSEQLIEIASNVDLAIGRKLIEPMASRERAALELFMTAVPRSNEAAWQEMAMKIGGFSKLNDIAEELRAAGQFLNNEEFYKAARAYVNMLKGHALEVWFWRSPLWRSREAILLDAAFRRAAKLGNARAAWRPLVITEPLLTMGGMGRRAGLEIYDGTIIIARDYKPGSDVVEGFLDVAIQLKAEKNISVIKQVSKDIRREAELGGITELRTRDGQRTIRLLPAPDNAEPLRLIVAPELPAASRLAEMPAGVNVAAIPTLLNAEQFGDLAIFLLRAAAGGP